MTDMKPFSISLKIVVYDGDGQILILKRSPKSKNNAGKWDFPGGKMEPGEPFDQGLLREVAEETGLVVSIIGVAGCAQSELPDRIVAYMIMEGRHIDGQVQLSDEHDEYLWVPRCDLPKMDLAAQFRDFVEKYV